MCLLQTLWTSFFENGPESYVSLSEMEFPVDLSDIRRLTDAGVIEIDPENSERARLIDFTE